MSFHAPGSGDDRPIQRRRGRTFGSLCTAYVNRRQVLGLGVASLAAVVLPLPALADRRGRSQPLNFTPIDHSTADQIIVPPGYRVQTVLAWGDPITADAADIDLDDLRAADQMRQAGYNNDFVAYLPLRGGGSEHGLLCVSFEYANPEMMFAAYPGTDEQSREQAEVVMAAHGMGVTEVRCTADGNWQVVRPSRFNRRLSAFSPIRISGPAAGDPRMRTAADPSGRLVIGTVNNCAGGLTPWGTWLQAEENFHDYFKADPQANGVDQEEQARYGIDPDGSRYGWERFHDRFDLSKEPHEANRFGWVVELDPLDPDAEPVKRTALGRFKHEAATTVIAPGQRVVVYSGDDQRFEYVYKFVSRGRYTPNDRAANSALLDDGTLYVARFDMDAERGVGTGAWLPLVWGTGPLTPANGFDSQADVLIRTRTAADLLGATPMDRPEDVQANPITGAVYVVLTKNKEREEDQVDPANPRASNSYGHIIELREADGDHAAIGFEWEIFLLGGPGDEGSGSLLANPDNIAFDRAGNLWVATDGQEGSLGVNDGVYRVPVAGPRRGVAQQFLSGVPGSEICGPCFTPDDRTFFCAIQHPGAGSGATFAEPRSRFPDYRDDRPPRPVVIAVSRVDGGPIE